MKKKILLLVDNRGWAYETKANALIDNYKGDRFEFEIIAYKDSPEQISTAFARNDYYVCFGFQNFPKCEKKHGAKREKALVSVASHASWDNGQTQPDNQVLPDKRVIQNLSSFKSVSVVSRRLQKLFKKQNLFTYYTPNGVPTNQFTPDFSFQHSKKLVIGYAGRDRDQKKGNKSFIIPAANVLQNSVDLKLAICDFILERRTGTRGDSYKDYEDMPDFYKRLDVYICASREEGSCRSVLEAMASGCAIISTDCGAINELINDGEGGFIVKRNINAIVKAIQNLIDDRHLLTRMKIHNRQVIESFDWSFISNHWYKWFEEVIDE